MSEPVSAPGSDLWGEPIPDPPAPTPLPGPRHLDIPSGAPAWFREELLRLSVPERDRAIQDWLDTENRRRKARERERRRWQAGNPLLITFGRGPDGQACGVCVHLLRSGRYFKCALRGKPTHGSATDHRAKWPACGKFEVRASEGRS